MSGHSLTWNTAEITEGVQESSSNTERRLV